MYPIMDAYIRAWMHGYMHVEDLEEEVMVGGIRIKALRFADDQTMVGKSQKGLQTMMDRLDITSREYEMKISIEKTKIY